MGKHKHRSRHRNPHRHRHQHQNHQAQQHLSNGHFKVKPALAKVTNGKQRIKNKFKLLASAALSTPPTSVTPMSAAAIRTDDTSASTSEQPGNPLLVERRSLPIWQHKRDLLALLKQHRVLILISSTGSGKSTQMPQFLLEASSSSCRVAVTQPRRIAAISLAQRVALETGRGPPGALIGYKVRFEECVGPATAVTFLTDGMLLREALLDAKLSKYSHIILDEAHERSLATDLLFGVVKLALARRSDLRLVVMSATLDPEPFCRFFPGSKLVYLTGRQHPIELMSVEEPVTDYLSSALVAVLQLHRSKPLVPTHDFLVFLTGEDEIAELRRLIRQAAEHLRDPSLVPLPLYAALPAALQLKALAPLSGNNGTPAPRKVILATNLAESSLTIPGVRCVIDCGRAKVRTAGGATGWVERLSVERISQAQAWQRAGRAARQGPGSCYRLYTNREMADSMPEQPVPELLRASLGTALLTLIGVGATQPENFPLLDRLPEAGTRSGLRMLERLGAVTGDEGSGWQLTPLGRDLLAMPLEPRLARVVIAAAEPRLGCLAEVLKIVSLLSVDHLFYVPANKREAAETAWQPYESSHGDLIFLLNLFNAFLGLSDPAEKARWLASHFVSVKALSTCLQVRKQLRSLCRTIGLPVASCRGGSQEQAIIEAFLTGFRHSTAALIRDGENGSGGSGGGRRYLCRSLQHPAFIHPSSVLFSAHPPAVMFLECVHTVKPYLRHVTAIKLEQVYRHGGGSNHQ